MLQAKKSSERKQLVEMVTNYQLIRGIIKLLSLDPMLSLVSPKVCVYVCVGAIYVRIAAML